MNGLAVVRDRPAAARFAVLVSIFPWACVTAEEPVGYVRGRDEQRPQPIVAVDNVCAWPNLTVMPDGQVLIAYYASKTASHRRYHMGVVIWDPAASASLPAPTDDTSLPGAGEPQP
jgi:hypothetical protein